MSGFEAAGLILSIIPIVVEIVDWYESRVRGRDTKHLVVSLENNKHIFLNSIELLLLSAVPAAQVQALLRDTDGREWKDKSLERRVSDVLGDDANVIFSKIQYIYKTLLKLQKKLPDRDVANVDQSMIWRARHVIKCFVHAPYYKTSLDSLRISIEEFRKLVDDAISLAPSRRIMPGALQNLHLVTECASHLHNTFQAGWQCDCAHLHPANIKLDTWSLPRNKRMLDEAEDARLKFSFLFATDADRAHSDHWITAEIAPLNNTPYPPPVPPDKRSREDDPKRSISFQSDTTTLNAVSLSTSFTIPATVKEAIEKEDIDDVISDLCSLFKTPSQDSRSVRRRLGSMSSSKTPVILFNEPAHLLNIPTRRSVKLSELLIRQDRLSMKIRIQIALMLAWGVLQISSTPWLNGKWTKDNILLVMDSQNNALPYVVHGFQSSRDPLQKSTTLDPETTNHIDAWIRSASLFALGVFLLEMAFSRAIEDLAKPDEKGDKGEPRNHTHFLTAHRLANIVQDEMGLHYSQAVNACINQPEVDVDADGNPKDHSQFAKSMLNNIIEPLETCNDRIFAK